MIRIKQHISYFIEDIKHKLVKLINNGVHIFIEEITHLYGCGKRRQIHLNIGYSFDLEFQCIDILRESIG